MRRKSVSVVIADSHTESRNFLYRHLEDAGFPVRSASSAEDVFVLCDIDRPDVFIIDAQLDGMDGYEVCERVRHEAKHDDITIIIMSDIVDEMTKVYLGQMVDFAGGDFYVAKPCDVHWLVRILDTLPKCGHRNNNWEARLIARSAV